MREWSARGRFNWLLVGTLAVIGGLGLVNLHSASRSAAQNLALFQAIWFGCGLIVASVFAFLDYRLADRLAYPLFVVSLLSLLAVLAFGVVRNNSKSWFDLGLFNVQPSEMAKIALIVALAKYFSDDVDLVRQRSTVSKLLIWAHPVYPIALAGAVMWLWQQLVAWGHWRMVIIFGCAVWEAYAIFLHLRNRRAVAELPGRPSRRPAKGYTLDDLIKPSTPLYPVGAAGALILFWEKDPLALLAGWRFVLLGVCFVWAAVSFSFVLRTGRTRLHDLLSPVIVVALPAILIMRQPDLGSAMVLLVTAASMILFMKVRLVSFIIAVAVLAAASVASWHLVLKPYQKERFVAYFEPTVDTKDIGYHALQSKIAVGAGQLTGKGYGKSTQTRFQFLPEQHTDFVFSVWAEERGFIGCAAVLLLFLFLLVQIVNVASGARDLFGVLLCVGLAALDFWQVFINIGMVIGVLPVVGLTLPLWSYGGSSVLALMVGFGLVVSVSFHRGP